jgi:undecaprenyl phosphate-alpha-L-ara4FN deformylase
VTQESAIGLRIDVDTYRGTRLGIPRLRDILEKRQIRATFFVSVGPDNMGRHLWRLLKPKFLLKMLRSNAPGLYGWDILLAGVCWPGREIAGPLASVLAATAAAGHEIGFHAWDHHRWQARIDLLSREEIRNEIARGLVRLRGILDCPIRSSAAPGWKCNDRVLEAKEEFGLLYGSDCRGSSIFRPIIDKTTLPTPQIPVTLPTFDEAVGRGGIGTADFFPHIRSVLRRDGLNVLTIHAEAEGGILSGAFERFVDDAMADGYRFLPLCDLLENADFGSFPGGRIIPNHAFPGREGWVACQAPP